MSIGNRDRKPRVIAVAGGKGGVGKSLLAANVGIFLATLGKRVVLVDGALGGATLHIFTGMTRAARTLSEALLSPDVSLADLVVPTPVPGLRMVAGISDPAWVASPDEEQVARIIRGVREIDADVVMLDLGSGTQADILDLFLAADVGLLVAVPEPSSIELLYRFVRAAFMRKLEHAHLLETLAPIIEQVDTAPSGIPAPLDLYLRAVDTDAELASRLEREILDFRPHLVVNSARSKADMELGRALASAMRRRLGLPITYLGHLEYDEAVWVAVRRRRPLLIEHPESRVSKCLEKMARRLIAAPPPRPNQTERVQVGDSHYELLEIAPTASFEDIRRANRRIREIYARESIVVGGLFTDEMLDQLNRRFDEAYATLMDAGKRKAYDHELFPDGVPSRTAERMALTPPKVEIQPTERPPMPQLAKETVYTGALMKQVREAQGIELREIAERTKIGMAYLQSIEEENFTKLPAAVYVRGFLVEYSKVVGLDASRVVETFLERYRTTRAAIEEEQERWP